MPAYSGTESPGEDSRAEHPVVQDMVGLVQETEGLRRRLVTQAAIEQAKGVLMGFYGIDADTAFSVLVRWSQHTNTKLHLLAADLVAAVSHSPEQPYAGPDRFIAGMPEPWPHLPSQGPRR